MDDSVKMTCDEQISKAIRDLLVMDVVLVDIGENIIYLTRKIKKTCIIYCLTRKPKKNLHHISKNKPKIHTSSYAMLEKPEIIYKVGMEKARDL
jgi:hypothetical protein